MRYLVLSDIHSNLEALDAVLRASAAQQYDAVLVLGDLVGYGADPNAVVDRVRGLEPAAIVRGNHDKVAAGLDDAEDFNPMAKSAAHWTRESLTPQTLDYLRDLPAGPVDRRRRSSRFATARRSTKICTWSPTSTPRARLPWRARRSASSATRTSRSARRMDGQRRLEIEAPQGHPEFATSPSTPDSKYLINPGLGRPAARRRRARRLCDRGPGSEGRDALSCGVSDRSGAEEDSGCGPAADAGVQTRDGTVDRC